MANANVQPLTQFFTFSESGLNIPADTIVSRTYDIERSDWTHGIVIVKNTSTVAASPTNTGRNDEGGVFFFTRNASEATGESCTSYTLSFSPAYTETVLRPSIYNRETSPTLSNRFLGETNPGRRILISDMAIDGTNLAIDFYPTGSTGDDLDCKIYVRVFNTPATTSSFSLLTMGGQSGEQIETELAKSDQTESFYTPSKG